MLVVVDYGMGNLHSVAKALERVGGRPVVTDRPELAARADRLVLPGVGAFAEAMEHLRRTGLDQAVLEHIRSGRPFLGICLGLQLLASRSREAGVHQGLNLIAGECVRFEPAPDPAGRPLRVPHMGWNRVHPTRPLAVFTGIPQGTFFYFVHSYYLRPEDPQVVAAETDYGVRFCSLLQRDNILACQFHPEKSQRWGLKLLENWLRLG